MRGDGRPDPDARRPGRGDLGPGAAGVPGGPAERGWGGQRGAGPASRGVGAPRGSQPAGRDELRRGPGRGPGGPVDSPLGPRPGPAVRWLGTLPTRTAAYILLGATLLGVIGTLVTGREPGFLLGFAVIVGSVVAAFGIRRRRLHLLIPLPVIVLFIGAVLVGAIHDRSMDTSMTELGVNFLQWIAGAFFAMCVATILVLVIGGGRWVLSKQLVSGQFSMSGGRPGADRGPRPRPAPGLRPDAVGKPGPEPRDGRGTGASRAGRDVPQDRDRRSMGGQPNGSDRWGARNGRGGRPSFTPRDEQDSRTPRDDRPRRTL
jgi:hypothetical protein